MYFGIHLSKQIIKFKVSLGAYILVLPLLFSSYSQVPQLEQVNNKECPIQVNIQEFHYFSVGLEPI